MRTVYGVDHPFKPHDHRRCIRTAIDNALRICRERGARLTTQRRRVLELVWRSHKPVGAYAVLEQLREEGFNGAPPTVYRALEFLLEYGLIHRIESLNAYIGCTHPGVEHAGQFLICSGCESVAELDDPKIKRAIRNTATHRGFSAADQVIEIHGVCAKCR